MSQNRRDRNVPTIVFMENITTTDRRDFPVPFGRMKHTIMPLRQIMDEKFMLGSAGIALTITLRHGIINVC